MGIKDAKTADVPNPQDLIDAQGKANRVDQFNPFGNTVFTQNPDGSYRSDFNFSEELAPLFGNFANLAKPQGTDNQYQDIAFNRAQELIGRDFDIREDQTRQNLADRGLPEDSEAFANALRDRVQDPRQRAIESAAFGSIQAGDARRNNDFNLLSQILGRGQQAPTPQLNVLGPYNLAQQQSNANANAQSNADQALWGNLTKIGGSIFL